MKRAAIAFITLSLLGCDARRDKASEASHDAPKNKNGRTLASVTPARDPSERLGTGELATKSPAELKILWEQSEAGNLSQDDQADYRIAILRRIIETEGLEQALPLVCSMPAGISRHGLVEAVFGLSDQPLDQLMKIRSRLQEKDQEAAFLELEYQTRVKGKYTLSDLKGVDLGEGRNGELLSAVTNRMMKDLRAANGFSEDGTKTTIRQTFESIAEFYRSGEVSPEHARKAVGELIKSPFNCWSILDSGSESAEELFAAKRETIISGMASHDPLRAIEQLKTSTISRDRDFGILFASWIRLDSAAPKTWLESNKSTLPEESLNSVSSAFAMDAAQKGDLEEASSWLSEVHSEELKNEVRSAIDSKRTEQILDRMKDHPQDTMEALISGDAADSVTTALTAYQSWVEQDSGEAYKWFSSQANTLKPEFRNEIAKLYAEKALKEGDVARAQEWLEVVERTAVNK